MKKDTEITLKKITDTYNQICNSNELHNENIIAFHNLSYTFAGTWTNYTNKEKKGLKAATSVLYENRQQLESIKSQIFHTMYVDKENILSMIDDIKNSHKISYLVGITAEYFKKINSVFSNISSEKIEDILLKNELSSESDAGDILSNLIEHGIISKEQKNQSTKTNREILFLIYKNFVNLELNPKTTKTAFQNLEFEKQEFYHATLIKKIKDNESENKKSIKEIDAVLNLLFLYSTQRHSKESLTNYYNEVIKIIDKEKIKEKIAKKVVKGIRLDGKFFFLQDPSQYLVSLSNEEYFPEIMKLLFESLNPNNMEQLLFFKNFISTNESLKKYEEVFLSYHNLYADKEVSPEDEKIWEHLYQPVEKKTYIFNFPLQEIIGDKLDLSLYRNAASKYVKILDRILKDDKIEKKIQIQNLNIQLEILIDKDEVLPNYIFSRLKLINENKAKLVRDTDEDLIDNMVREILLNESLEKSGNIKEKSKSKAKI